MTNNILCLARIDFQHHIDFFYIYIYRQILAIILTHINERRSFKLLKIIGSSCSTLSRILLCWWCVYYVRGKRSNSSNCYYVCSCVAKFLSPLKHTHTHIYKWYNTRIYYIIVSCLCVYIWSKKKIWSGWIALQTIYDNNIAYNITYTCSNMYHIYVHTNDILSFWYTKWKCQIWQQKIAIHICSCLLYKFVLLKRKNEINIALTL